MNVHRDKRKAPVCNILKPFEKNEEMDTRQLTAKNGPFRVRTCCFLFLQNSRKIAFTRNVILKIDNRDGNYLVKGYRLCRGKIPILAYGNSDESDFSKKKFQTRVYFF